MLLGGNFMKRLEHWMMPENGTDSRMIWKPIIICYTKCHNNVQLGAKAGI